MLPKAWSLASSLASSSSHAVAKRAATTLSAGFPRVTQRVSRRVGSHRPFSSISQLTFIQSPTKYGGVYTVTLIPGDGVGAEITDAVKEIVEHVNAPIEWDQYDVSGMSSSGDLFQQAMESLKRNRVGLKGDLSSLIVMVDLSHACFGVRHLIHAHISDWAYFMERRHASTA
jgi:isocitrate dehydrogenase (NAD+)